MNDPVTASWSSPTEGFCVLVHGGAGSRPELELPGELDGCALAAGAAATVLRAGGSALDAVQHAVSVLEDDPRFNAATGGALTCEGTLELDASIMDGSDLRAGAVCCLPPYLHPIAVARAVLDEGRHVLYAAAGADALARRVGLRPAAPDSMITQRAREQLARVLAGKPGQGGNTVGAVARDARGHLAAATSTGGITGKACGRVGDSPLLGAGTYADDLRGAASATGHGEGILRIMLSARVLEDMAAGMDPEAAARARIAELFTRIGSHAGVIVVAPDGRLSWARTSESMPWAAVWERGSAGGA